MVVLEKIGIQLSFDNPANCHNLFLIDITGHTVLKKRHWPVDEVFQFIY